MDQVTFDKFREIAYKKAGIDLKETKTALVSARIGKRMRALGCDTPNAYLNYLVHDQSGNELVHFLDCITTNLTSFFRENQHFEFLKETVPQWVRQGQRRFRFWSAACSTGEEPYSLAMTLSEALRGRVGDTKILATDLSTEVLQKAKAGIYSADRLKNMPLPSRSQYMREVHNSAESNYQVMESIRDLVVFRRLNLSAPPFPLRGPFDAVLCRNVMIYFDPKGRKRLIDEFHHLLRPGGYLMVGHAESLTGIENSFRCVRPSIYLKE
jgi:chemotaxis protein methyltransferase CheR